VPGDDIRTIDWNVSARAGSPHVKLFREERELTVMLAVDLSGSLSFGSQAQLKRERVAEVAATLAFSATRANDKVGLLLFTDRIERYVPPQKGRRHVLRIVRELLAFEPQGRGTDLPLALEELNLVLRKRSVLFVASDFLDREWERPMAILRRRHDVIPVVVGDVRERELPNVGLIELTDAETGATRVIDTSSRVVRESFAAHAARRSAELDTAMRMLRVEPVRVDTGADFVEPLVSYFRRREAARSR
jgi:uncharacterized protein (DUF58 family)